jgi:hypothetical protein
MNGREKPASTLGDQHLLFQRSAGIRKTGISDNFNASDSADSNRFPLPHETNVTPHDQ